MYFESLTYSSRIFCDNIIFIAGYDKLIIDTHRPIDVIYNHEGGRDCNSEAVLIIYTVLLSGSAWRMSYSNFLQHTCFDDVVSPMIVSIYL